MGFRAVVDAIARRGVPVVGHNALLDLAHTHVRFLGPLPDDVVAFKRNIHEAFPRCVFFRILPQMRVRRSRELTGWRRVHLAAPVCSIPSSSRRRRQRSRSVQRSAPLRPFPTCSIPFAFCHPGGDQRHWPGRAARARQGRPVCRPPRHWYARPPEQQGKGGACADLHVPNAAIVFAEDAARYGTDSGVYHEAGFDAYATGYAFLKMVHYLHGARACLLLFIHARARADRGVPMPRRSPLQRWRTRPRMAASVWPSWWRRSPRWPSAATASRSCGAT